MMNGMEKSDLAIVAMKPANNAVQTAAEWVEPRRGPREARIRPARNGHSAEIACHRGWIVYGKLQG